MSLGELLASARPAIATLWDECTSASAGIDAEAAGVLFMSVCNGKERAHVVTIRGKNFEQAWVRGRSC